jgi:hypothetical protein
MRRDWYLARQKVSTENTCRGCGRDTRALQAIARTLEAAHLAGREFDRRIALRALAADTVDLAKQPVYPKGARLPVEPDRIIPLCGPSTQSGTCHYALDLGSTEERAKLRLDSKLTTMEWAQLVVDLGGVALAWRRVTGQHIDSEAGV